MKTISNKKLTKSQASDDSSLLRLVYKNEEIINEEANIAAEKKSSTSKAKNPNKLFVKEPLPLFNDYKFKCRDHDPL